MGSSVHIELSDKRLRREEWIWTMGFAPKTGKFDLPNLLYTVRVPEDFQLSIFF
jgi:hypothetical protein